jgi:hypothetical protein
MQAITCALELNCRSWLNRQSDIIIDEGFFINRVRNIVSNPGARSRVIKTKNTDGIPGIANGCIEAL